jgi:hypothetical protein
MKKTYTTPTLVLSGDIVHETLNGATDGPEIPGNLVHRDKMIGSIGYYL